MNKRELDLLERAFSAEIEAAMTGRPHVIQPRGKLPTKLADEGYLEAAEVVWSGVRIKGFQLTSLGRMTYCMTCEGEA